MKLCKNIAGRHKIIAACFYDIRVERYPDRNSVLMVLADYRPKIKGHNKSQDRISNSFLTVDQKIFEMDVEKGWLGEFISEKIENVYEPIINKNYFCRQEAKLKTRLVMDILSNLVSEFPLLHQDLLIKPEYFPHEVMNRRARLFPFKNQLFLNAIETDLEKKNLKSMMCGYLKALEKLSEENLITYKDEYYKITPHFKKKYSSRKSRISDYSYAPKAFFYKILSVISAISQSKEAPERSTTNNKTEKTASKLEDSGKYLFLPTSQGNIAQMDRMIVENIMRKTGLNDEVADIEIDRLGGILNSAYLLTYKKDRKKHRLVVKRFRDWRGFKWFPLTLWTIGTRSFSVNGQTRLEQEYTTNRFLYNQGFPVPKIIYLSIRERLIFKEFVDGENLVEIVKRIVSLNDATTNEKRSIKSVGRNIARAHHLGVALGDCKPENIIVAVDGKTYFVDLEQATRNGNQAWDVANFLYYSGHYISPISSAEPIKIIAKEFLEGYLESGGNREVVRRVKSIRYIKAFSFFTPPQVILSISDICERISGNIN
jgi:tRNA A-37 threonylcarbamoyl transferase component Bud32